MGRLGQIQWDFMTNIRFRKILGRKVSSLVGDFIIREGKCQYWEIQSNSSINSLDIKLLQNEMSFCLWSCNRDHKHKIGITGLPSI